MTSSILVQSFRIIDKNPEVILTLHLLASSMPTVIMNFEPNCKNQCCNLFSLWQRSIHYYSYI